MDPDLEAVWGKEGLRSVQEIAQLPLEGEAELSTEEKENRKKIDDWMMENLRKQWEAQMKEEGAKSAEKLAGDSNPRKSEPILSKKQKERPTQKKVQVANSEPQTTDTHPTTGDASSVKKITVIGQTLYLHPTRESEQPSQIPLNWLRDNCQCPQCVHPSTSQKLHRSSTFNLDPSQALRLSREISLVELNGEMGVQIFWPRPKEDTESWRRLPDEPVAEQERHPSFYPLKFLRKYTPKRTIYEETRFTEAVTWDRAGLVSSPTLRIPYSEYISSPSSLHAAMCQLQIYGIVILTGVPTEKTTNLDCELRKAMNRTGEIRNTFYGETWDVKAIKDSKNIAYTNVDLGVHQDLCYFESPPRFQALHCLRNRVIGGSSYFVDAYAAIERLRLSHPKYYHLLTQAPVPFVYDNDGHYYFKRHLTIELAFPETGLPTFPKLSQISKTPVPIHAVNYSPPFQAPLDVNTPKEVYDALRKFDELLHQPESVYEFTLQEGEMVWFDNRRVMHARRAFHDKPESESMGQGEEQKQGETLKDGEATRWLKGCYMDGDVIADRLRYLTRLGLSRKEDIITAEGEAFEMLPRWNKFWNERMAQHESTVAQETR